MTPRRVSSVSAARYFVSAGVQFITSVIGVAISPPYRSVDDMPSLWVRWATPNRTPPARFAASRSCCHFRVHANSFFGPQLGRAAAARAGWFESSNQPPRRSASAWPFELRLSHTSTRRGAQSTTAIPARIYRPGPLADMTAAYLGSVLSASNSGSPRNWAAVYPSRAASSIRLNALLRSPSTTWEVAAIVR